MNWYKKYNKTSDSNMNPKEPDDAKSQNLNNDLWKFLNVLYEEYSEQVAIEKVGWVDLIQVRKKVCDRLKIDFNMFERGLNLVWPKTIKGEPPFDTYGLGIEVDITFQDRARYRKTQPIIVDGTPMWTINMRKRK